MKTSLRFDYITSLVNEKGFITVAELSRLCGVSEMTIRRDLEQLQAQKSLQRTFGGAIPFQKAQVLENGKQSDGLAGEAKVLLVDQVDVLIATAVNPFYDGLLIERASRKKIPIIAESIEMPLQLTCVAVDSVQAGRDLGIWVGQHLPLLGIQTVNLLDLTFQQSNTQERSRGFIQGLKETCQVVEILSINAQSRYAMAYQLAYDALTVYSQINVIFAINDTTAKGAMDACRDLKIDPGRMNVIPFGLEGDTLKNELVKEDNYCKVGLEMFPEIVSYSCLEAAITAYNHLPLPERYVTPHAILTATTLRDYYMQTPQGWALKWDYARKYLNLPINLADDERLSKLNMPGQVGFLIPFSEHEWYRNLTSMMTELAKSSGIGVRVIDAEQNVREEVEIRRRKIASKAASLIEVGEVVLVDSGPMAAYLANELRGKSDITVITNSVAVFNALNPTPGITLISTGGTLRYSSQVMVGPTAEGALKELRADRLFLMVSGISLDFGLSHHTISEVTIKQAMIRSAREVILLADHSSFGEEAGIQVAPLTVVHRLITDDALPPSTRLDISKVGIQITLV